MTLPLHTALKIAFNTAFPLVLYIFYAAGCFGLVHGFSSASSSQHCSGHSILEDTTWDFFDKVCSCL